MASCDDGAVVLNEVVMESVKEKCCESDETDENEQCAQSVQCDFDK